MSGAGHIADMIARMKNNALAKKTRQDRRKEIKESYLNGHHNSEQNQIREKVISREKLEKIKQKIRFRLAREKIFSTILTTIFSILAAIIFIFIVNLLVQSFNA